jgi:hypothetical protein
MKQYSFRKDLCAIGVSALASVAGCALPNPKPGQFDRELLVGVPSHPVIMALEAGKLKAEPVHNGDDWQAIDVTKYHWLLGEIGTQRLNFPEQSKREGVSAMKRLLDVCYFMAYDDESGDRRMLRYDVLPNAKKHRLAEEYLWNKDKEKFQLTKKHK